MDRRRRWVVRVIQYVLGALALAWVVLQPDWGRVARSLSAIPPAVVLAILGVTGVGLIARFYMWQVLLRELTPTKLVVSAKIDLVVNFVNQLLPSRLAGRSVGPLILRHFSGISWGDAVAVTGVHTGLYAMLYAVVGFAGLVAGLRAFSSGVTILIGLSTILYLVAGVATLSAGVHMETLYQLDRRVPVPQVIRRRLDDRAPSLVDALPSFTKESSSVFRGLLVPREVGTYGIAWLVALALVPGMRVWLLFGGMDVGFAPAELLPVYLVAAYSVTLLPLTPGGIGVTEATATVVFVSLGVPGEVVVPVVLLDRFLGVYLPALVGGYPALRVDLGELTAG